MSYKYSGCSGLTSITIPSSVTSIGGNAFIGSSGLTKVEYASVEHLCNISFSTEESNPLFYAHHLYLNGMEVFDLVIPETVTCIGNYAFYYCSGLGMITFSEGINSIGYYAFYHCSGLTSVTIPNTVTWIGDDAFSGSHNT